MWCSVPVGCHKFAVQVGCGWSTCFFVSGQTGYVRISSTMFDQLLTRSVDFDIFLQVFRWISSRLISQCLWKPRWNHRSGRECCHLFWRYQVELLEPVNSLGTTGNLAIFFDILSISRQVGCLVAQNISEHWSIVPWNLMICWAFSLFLKQMNQGAPSNMFAELEPYDFAWD